MFSFLKKSRIGKSASLLSTTWWKKKELCSLWSSSGVSSATRSLSNLDAAISARRLSTAKTALKTTRPQTQRTTSASTKSVRLKSLRSWSTLIMCFGRWSRSLRQSTVATLWRTPSWRKTNTNDSTSSNLKSTSRRTTAFTSVTVKGARRPSIIRTRCSSTLRTVEISRSYVFAANGWLREATFSKAIIIALVLLSRLCTSSKTSSPLSFKTQKLTNSTSCLRLKQKSSKNAWTS